MQSKVLSKNTKEQIAELQPKDGFVVLSFFREDNLNDYTFFGYSKFTGVSRILLHSLIPLMINNKFCFYSYNTFRTSQIPFYFNDWLLTDFEFKTLQ